jgi:hypothetical protein
MGFHRNSLPFLGIGSEIQKFSGILMENKLIVKNKTFKLFVLEYTLHIIREFHL